MKISLTFVITFFLFFLFSCKTTNTNYNQNLREIKYFQSRIHNIDRRTITLADGNQWKTNRFVIATNMTEVFFVIYNSGFGDAYINGTKYSVSRIGGFEEGFRYFYGFKNTLKTIESNKNTIELSDGSKWFILGSKGVDIKYWSTITDLIISEDENLMINPYKIQAIEVKRIRDEIQ